MDMSRFRQSGDWSHTPMRPWSSLAYRLQGSDGSSTRQRGSQGGVDLGSTYLGWFW